MNQSTTVAQRIAAGQTTRFGTRLLDEKAYLAAERAHGRALGVEAFHAGLTPNVHLDPAMAGTPAGYPWCNANMASSCVAAWREGYRSAAEHGAAPAEQPEPSYPTSTLKAWLAARPQD